MSIVFQLSTKNSKPIIIFIRSILMFLFVFFIILLKQHAKHPIALTNQTSHVTNETIYAEIDKLVVVEDIFSLPRINYKAKIKSHNPTLDGLLIDITYNEFQTMIIGQKYLFNIVVTETKTIKVKRQFDYDS